MNFPRIDPFEAFDDVPPLARYLRSAIRMPLIDDVLLHTKKELSLSIVSVLRSGTRLPLDPTLSDHALLMEQQRALVDDTVLGNYFEGRGFKSTNVLKGAVPRLINRWRSEGDHVFSLRFSDTRTTLILSDPEVNRAYLNAVMNNEAPGSIVEWYVRAFPDRNAPPSPESKEGQRMIDDFLGTINPERG